MKKNNTFQPSWEIGIRFASPRRLVSFADRNGRVQVRGDLVACVHTSCGVCVSIAVRSVCREIVWVGKARVIIRILSERKCLVVIARIVEDSVAATGRRGAARGVPDIISLN